MNRQDYLHLQAERKFLLERLAELPEGVGITRLSAEAKLRSVEEELAEAKINEREPARARLSYRGRPVVGSYGIFAEFGMSATRAFVDAVALITAALSGPLSSMGPIPNREQNQLLITGTVAGSFGFELEEYRAEQLQLDEESPVAQALELTQTLLRSTLGTDDELADSAAGTDPRALAALRAFLDTLAANNATCALEYQGQMFRFSDVGEVRRSLQRIRQDNLHEDRQKFKGEFRGVLPRRRTFEFKISGREEVIDGKIGPAVADADVLNDHLRELARIEVMATRVGNGRPRFVLIEQPEWLGGGSDQAQVGGKGDQ